MVTTFLGFRMLNLTQLVKNGTYSSSFPTFRHFHAFLDIFGQLSTLRNHRKVFCQVTDVVRDFLSGYRQLTSAAKVRPWLLGYYNQTAGSGRRRRGRANNGLAGMLRELMANQADPTWGSQSSLRAGRENHNILLTAVAASTKAHCDRLCDATHASGATAALTLWYLECKKAI
jgi:hypothetical protein